MLVKFIDTPSANDNTEFLTLPPSKDGMLRQLQRGGEAVDVSEEEYLMVASGGYQVEIVEEEPPGEADHGVNETTDVQEPTAQAIAAASTQSPPQPASPFAWAPDAPSDPAVPNPTTPVPGS